MKGSSFAEENGGAVADRDCDAQEVLQVDIVRQGLTLYQDHIQRSKLKRQKSYERSLLHLGSSGSRVRPLREYVPGA